LALAWNFLQFSVLFGWPIIKTNEKTQKQNLKHFSGGERAQRAAFFFVEKNKISTDSGIWLALAWKVSRIFGCSTTKINGKTQKLGSKHVSYNLLKFGFFQQKFLLFELVHHQKHVWS
jgi:hypothetical protein